MKEGILREEKKVWDKKERFKLKLIQYNYKK